MIPLVPIDEAGDSLALIAQSRVFDRLSERFEAADRGAFDALAADARRLVVAGGGELIIALHV